MLRLYVCFYYPFICHSVYAKRSSGCRNVPFITVVFMEYVDILFRLYVIPYTAGEIRGGAGMNRL